MQYQVKGMPGPVWTMLLWASVTLATRLERLASGTRPSLPWAPEVLGEAAIILTLLILRRRTPRWALRAFVLTQIALVGLVTATAPDPVVMMSSAIGMIVAVLYVALWWPGRESWAVTAIASLTLLAGLAANDLALNYRSAWFSTTALLVAIALGVQIVVERDQRLRTHDHLTGLLNRSGLQHYLHLRPRAGRITLPRTLVMADVDGFKALNDTRGHAAGDAALRQLARSWTQHLRPDDVIVRLGGDEFLIILPGTDVDGARALVARLRQSSPLPWSAGVVDWAPDEEFASAHRRADRLMYEDKHARAPLA